MIRAPVHQVRHRIRHEIHWRWVTACVLAYLATLAAAIAATVIFELPLTSSGGFLVFPSAWGFFLVALMYAVPLALALVAATLRRPFWPNFLAVVGVVFVLHVLHGGAATALRGLRALDWKADVAATEAADWTIKRIDVVNEDDDGDGLVDRVALNLRIDPRSLPAGDYALRVGLRPAGMQGVSGAPTAGGGREFTLGDDAAPFDLVLALSPKRVAAVAAANETSLRFDLTRWMTVPADTEALLQVCAWAALFCPTRLSGYDPVIRQTAIQLPSLATRRTLDLPPERVQRDQVVFQRYLGDRGRDDDGDGRFDALVIAMELDSIWDGPIYAQAYLDVAQRFLPTFESRMGRGVVEFEYAIDGATLSRLGRDGPYRVTDLYLLNNTPLCPQVQCPNDNRPMFSLRLPNYTTGFYRAADFE